MYVHTWFIFLLNCGNWASLFFLMALILTHYLSCMSPLPKKLANKPLSTGVITKWALTSLVLRISLPTFFFYYYVGLVLYRKLGGLVLFSPVIYFLCYSVIYSNIDFKFAAAKYYISHNYYYFNMRIYIGTEI